MRSMAILFGAVLLAGTMAYLGRWDIRPDTTPTAAPEIIRYYALDRWKGRLLYCNFFLIPKAMEFASCSEVTPDPTTAVARKAKP